MTTKKKQTIIEQATAPKQVENNAQVEQELEKAAEQEATATNQENSGMEAREIDKELETGAEQAMKQEATSNEENSPEVNKAQELEKEVESTTNTIANKKKVVNKVVQEKVNPFHNAAKEIFARHKNISTLFFTQDATPFMNIQHAKMHGETLADTHITTVTNLEVQ
jgi:hypothetical protein